MFFTMTLMTEHGARPSGTEPKVKFYMGVKGTSFDDAQEKLNALSDAVMKVVAGE